MARSKAEWNSTSSPLPPLSATSPNSSKNINHGVVSGPALAIESALGGSYELALDGDRLSGVYTRGTTYKVAVTFTRS